MNPHPSQTQCKQARKTPRLGRTRLIPTAIKRLGRFWVLLMLGLLLTLGSAFVPLNSLTQAQEPGKKTSVSSALQEAQQLNAKGRQQLANGQAALALKTWRSAETQYQAAQNNKGVLGSQLNQATALQVLGFYRQARQQLNHIETQLDSSSDSLLKAQGLLSLGNLLRLQGETERSQTLLTASLAIAQALPNSTAPITSQVHLSLANTLRTQNQAQVALKHYQQAATLAPSELLRRQAQLNQLSLRLEQNDLSAAIDLALTLAPKLTQLSLSSNSISARVNFAQSLITLNETNPLPPSLPAVESILKTAIEQAHSLGDVRSQSYALGILGHWYEQQGNWDEAIATTHPALKLAEALQADDIAYQWHWQLGRIFQHQFEEGPSNPTSANLSVMQERAIAQYSAAIENLSALRSDLTALNPDVQFEFRAQVEPVYRQLVALLLHAPEPTSEQLAQARQVIEALQLAELDNFFRDACASPEEINIDNLDANAAILYPILLPDRLELILKLPGDAKLKHYSHTGLSAERVNQAVQALTTLLKRRSSNPQQLKASAQQLYSWLIQPFETELETALDREQSEIKTLSFVLDGPLRNLPMGALYDGNRYLIERYAVAVTPGLNLLDPKPLPRKALRVLVAGAENAPSFRAANLAPLQNVSLELEGIQNNLAQTEVLADEVFLKGNLSQQINKQSFNIVHLATHGQFSADPEETFLLDWQDRISTREMDELLFLDDPRRAVQDPIELLVLSACETAAGDDRAALGLAGIAIRAGARSTVASLWRIDDASTAEFMVRFYKELANTNLSKAEALRNIQLAFLKEYKRTDYRRPYHWAPFILLGNWL